MKNGKIEVTIPSKSVYITKPLSECLSTSFKKNFIDKSPDIKAATTPTITASRVIESAVFPVIKSRLS